MSGKTSKRLRREGREVLRSYIDERNTNNELGYKVTIDRLNKRLRTIENKLYEKGQLIEKSQQKYQVSVILIIALVVLLTLILIGV